MKNKGIVRRMDELGRIVIPREFRKVSRINEGDPMSISLQENGDLLITKVDFMGELVGFGAQVCQVLAAETGNTVLLYGGGEVKAGSGSGSKAMVGWAMSKEFSQAIETGKLFTAERSELDGSKTLFAIPIMSGERIYGAIAMLSDAAPSPLEQRIISVASKILGGIIQNY